MTSNSSPRPEAVLEPLPSRARHDRGARFPEGSREHTVTLPEDRSLLDPDDSVRHGAEIEIDAPRGQAIQADEDLWRAEVLGGETGTKWSHALGESTPLLEHGGERGRVDRDHDIEIGELVHRATHHDPPAATPTIRSSLRARSTTRPANA